MNGLGKDISALITVATAGVVKFFDLIPGAAGGAAAIIACIGGIYLIKLHQANAEKVRRETILINMQIAAAEREEAKQRRAGDVANEL